jgi:hypothetical protein
MDDIAVARETIGAQNAAELIVGGTGLYVTAIVDGLQMPGEWPEIRATLEAREDTEALFAELFALDPEATIDVALFVLLKCVWEVARNSVRLVRELEPLLPPTLDSSVSVGIETY